MKNNKNTKITIYTTPTCIYCKLTKEFFKQNDIKFKEYNVAKDLKKAKEMIEKSGQQGVPVIDINGKIIIGFNKNELKEALNL
jgi:glutaredoxin-like YruB-family protein